MTRPLDALPAGSRVLDRYLIETELRTDELGISYSGRDSRRDIPVVVVEYLPLTLAARTANGDIVPRSDRTEQAYRSGLTRFIANGRALAQASHRHIGKVLSVGESAGSAYLVMEQVQGRTLEEEVLAGGPLPQEEVRRLFDLLAAGLSDIHERGLLHLDVKPSNVIMRSPDSTPVLVGFGSAQSLGADAAGSFWALPPPGYAAIEQYSPRAERGPWTDVYALGAVAYFALTGKTPLDAPERIRDPKPLEFDATRAVDKRLANAIEFALKVDSSDRPQVMAEWQTALADSSPASLAGKVRRERKAHRGRRVRKGVNRRRVFYGVGITVIAAVATAVVMVARNASLSFEELAARAEAQLGMTPETISLIEMGLADAGHYEGEPDGVMDAESREGLRDWQTAQGLDPTGYLDRESVVTLVAAGEEAERQAEIEAAQAAE